MGSSGGGTVFNLDAYAWASGSVRMVVRVRALVVLL